MNGPFIISVFIKQSSCDKMQCYHHTLICRMISFRIFLRIPCCIFYRICLCRPLQVQMPVIMLMRIRLKKFFSYTNVG